jgi:Ca-activated chloride channel family protein
MRPALIALAGIAALAIAGPDALGRLALRAGFDRPAALLLEDPAARGVALYRLGDYPAADAAFARAGRSQTYNRGVSLAAVADYPLSVAYFNAMLFANPADEQARRNRDLVAAMIPPHQGASTAPGRIMGAGGLPAGDVPLSELVANASRRERERPLDAKGLAATDQWLDTIVDDPG